MRKTTRKSQAGITLIALIVTIIVLIILAGVAISMLSGDNGILNRASDASVATEIGAFKEKVSLAQMSLKATISSKSASNPGYVATKRDNMDELAREVAKEIGVNEPIVIATSNGTENAKVTTEGYTVAYSLDTKGDNGADGHGYIIIGYTSNSLRGQINTDTAEADYSLAQIGTVSRNSAELVAVIHVGNYSSEIVTFNDTNSNAQSFGLTSISNLETDINKTAYSLASLNTSTVGVNKSTGAGSGVPISDFTKIKIGDKINYTAPNPKRTNNWEVFYVDGDKIYIIAVDKHTSTEDTLNFYKNNTTVMFSSYNGTSDFVGEGNILSRFPAVQEGLLSQIYDKDTHNLATTLTSQTPNLSQIAMKFTEYMLDSVNVWNSYYKNASQGANWAIGGPTLELLCLAYDKYAGNEVGTHTANIIPNNSDKPTNYGYDQGGFTSDNPLGTAATNNPFRHTTNVYYWLASPSNTYAGSVRYVYGSYGYVYTNTYDNTNSSYGFRPIVQLSGISLEGDGTSGYEIIK